VPELTVFTRCTCNLDTQEAEAGGSQVQGLPGLLSKTLLKKRKSQVWVAPACNRSYSGGRHQKDRAQSQPRQIVHETLSEKTLHKKRLVEWLKVKALSSNPSTKEREREGGKEGGKEGRKEGGREQRKREEGKTMFVTILDGKELSPYQEAQPPCSGPVGENPRKPHQDSSHRHLPCPPPGKGHTGSLKVLSEG
jgi:hypothetical protein